MEIQRLKSEIIANIRSSSTINNVTQCLTELVLNSLDSKSTAVAVRVNLVTFKIQVVDNGEGITKANLELVGLRYMTNKCNNLVHLEKHIKYHGFRGEALASIINISKKVNITTKHIKSTETYAKDFGKHIKNQVISVKNRPSFGTTVTVEGFLYNLPIRRNRIVPELELEDVKRSIESLIIMYPNVSFSVRNDLSGNLIINSQKTKDIISSFKCLHPKIDEEFSVMKVSKDKVTVEAVLLKNLFANKHLQYVYVNKRPVHCLKIQKFVTNIFFKNNNFNKSKSLNSKIVNDKNKHPVFVINIKCPHSHVDILLNPSKTLIEFKNWTLILQCLEKLVNSFFGKHKTLGAKDLHLNVCEKFKSDGGTSQIYGALRGYGYKRKQSEETKPQKACSQNSLVIEESGFSAHDREFAISTGNKTVKQSSDFIHKDPLVDENFARSQKQFDKHEKYREDNKHPNRISIENEQIISLFLDESRNYSISPKFKKLPTDEIKTNENINKSVSDNDIYSITDTTPAKKPKVKIFRKPLPIKIKHENTKTGDSCNFRSPSKTKLKRQSSMNVSPCVDENENCNIEEIPAIQPTLKQTVRKKLDDEKSTLSKFTADENKGKNLIMDMFLKSTQVYSTEEANQNDTKSDETILEVESNFLFENNIQTKVNGLSKTMSMSVNIRSTKKIKKQKFKPNRTEKADRTSKCIQTTLEDIKMVSECIQTTMDRNFLKNRSKLRCNDFGDILVAEKPAENYTVVLSDSTHLKETPRFRFIYRTPSRFNMEPINKFTSSNNCKCNCHSNTSKMFHFVDSVDRKNKKQAANNILSKNIGIFASDCELNKIDVSSMENPHTDGEIGYYEKVTNLAEPEINWFVQNNSQHEQRLNNIACKSYEPVKHWADNKTEHYEDIKHTSRNPTQAEINQFVQNYIRHRQQHLKNVPHRHYEPVKLRKDGKTENYDGIKHTTRNPTQLKMNWFEQNCGQREEQDLNNVLHKHEPVKFQEDGKTNYEGTKHTARNFMQAEMNQFVQDYDQHIQQHLNNVWYRNYEPVEHLADSEIDNCEGIKHSERNSMQTERKQFLQNYHQHKQLVNNILYTDYEPVARNIPNIVQKPSQEGFVTRHKKTNKTLQSVVDVDRSPYFVPPHDPLYPKTNVANRMYENRFNEINLKDQDFFNVVPNNADSYVVFDPQYCSTQLRDCNKTRYSENLNKIYENRFNKANLTLYPAKDFLNIVPNNTDSYILFDPHYRSTQLGDYNKNTNLKNLNRIYENKFNEANLTPYPIKDKACVDIVSHNTDSYIQFNPQYRSTQLRDFNKRDDRNLEIFGGGITGDPLQNEADFTIDHFGNFKPAYKSTQHDRMKSASMESFQWKNDVHTPFVECNKSSSNSQLDLVNVSEDVCGNLNPFDHMANFTDNLQLSCNMQNNSDRKMDNRGLKKESQRKSFVFELNNQNNSNPPIDLDATCQTIQENISPENAGMNQKLASKRTGLNGHSDEQLIITLSNQEKQELLRRELNAERDLNAKQYLEWDSLSELPGPQQDTQPSDYQKFGMEWVKMKNNFGSSFYINKRTGFTTFFTPKPNCNQFTFGRRLEFVPKGSSPILKEVKQVDKSLNQNDKEKLQDYILECHQNELLIVKWQNYIKHNDPKTFFDEVYKEKLKLFENCIPNIHHAVDKKKYLSEPDDIMHFNKTLFDSINVIGQVDRKFIAVVEKTKDLLILFDQHAVHERIRLEELLKVYTNVKIKWMERLVFFIPPNDLSLLKKHELYLSFLGLSVEFFVNGINVLEIPLCIYNKFKDNDNQSSMSDVIQLLVNEVIELLKETRGVSFENFPKLIQNIINLEACRGAIKFGDNLSKQDCVDLLAKLAVCKLSFQCAHGRPTLTPLVRLNLTQKCVPYKVNLKKAVGILGVPSIAK